MKDMKIETTKYTFNDKFFEQEFEGVRQRNYGKIENIQEDHKQLIEGGVLQDDVTLSLFVDFLSISEAVYVYQIGRYFKIADKEDLVRISLAGLKNNLEYIEHIHYAENFLFTKLYEKVIFLRPNNIECNPSEILKEGMGPENYFYARLQRFDLQERFYFYSEPLSFTLSFQSVFIVENSSVHKPSVVLDAFELQCDDSISKNDLNRFIHSDFTYESKTNIEGALFNS